MPGPTLADFQKIAVAAQPTPGMGLALSSTGTVPTSAPVTALRVLTADPSSPAIGEFWYRSDTSQLCVRHDANTTKRSAAFT
jgi:hypothetical protein